MCWEKISFFPLFRWTNMSNYKIFDLLYSDVIGKLDAYNRVLMYKYVVGKQRIRIHLLKPNEEIGPIKILDFLNKLQEKYAYHCDWSPFYFSSYSVKYQNITIFVFLSRNEEKFWMYQHFCNLSISWLVLFTLKKLIFYFLVY